MSDSKFHFEKTPFLDLVHISIFRFLKPNKKKVQWHRTRARNFFGLIPAMAQMVKSHFQHSDQILYKRKGLVFSWSISCSDSPQKVGQWTPMNLVKKKKSFQTARNQKQFISFGSMSKPEDDLSKPFLKIFNIHWDFSFPDSEPTWTIHSILKKIYLDSSTTQTKKNIFIYTSSTQKQKNIFLDSSTQQQKNIFRFLDPTTKNKSFYIPLTQTKKKYFSDSLTQTKKKYFSDYLTQQKKYF